MDTQHPRGPKHTQGVISPEIINRLPVQMRQYLNCTKVSGKPWIRQVYLEQKGLFNVNGKRWMNMSARQWINLEKNEFVWKAKAGIFRVTDQYIDGKGKLTPRLFGLIKLGEAKGPEVDQGEALRFLTELIWYPTFACAPAIRWEEVSRHSCKASFTMRNKHPVIAYFHFNDQFLIERITAKRYREVNGRFELNDWEINHLEYRDFNTILVPHKAHVNWKLPEGELCYYKLEMTRLQYEWE